MERCRERLAIAGRALSSLEEILALVEPATIVRDAAIQRFEYTHEAVWKAVQSYLREVEGLDIGSPKGVVRACRQAGILGEDDAALALRMSDDRNLTAHTYNEALALVIFSRLPDSARLMRQWLNAMRAQASQ
jgi:nucleotidyltransferase substrate binding protein (TIGR01987 family)